MLITFKDSQEATKNEYKEHAEGVYQVKITKVTEGVWSQAKSEYLEVEFETMGEDVFTVRHRFTKSQKALSILLNLLSAVGIYDKDSKEDLRFENDDLLGSILKVEFVKGDVNANGKQYLELKPWSCEEVSGLASPKTAEKKTEDELIGEEEVPF
jgi:hypothetical protein